MQYFVSYNSIKLEKKSGLVNGAKIITGSEGDWAATTFVNQHSSQLQLHSKYLFLCPQTSVVSQTSSKRHLLSTDREHHSKPQSNCREQETILCPVPVIDLQHDSCTQGSAKMEGKGRYKSQQNRKFYCENMSPRNVSGYTYEIPSAWLPKQDLNSDTTNGRANVGGGSSQGQEPGGY